MDHITTCSGPECTREVTQYPRTGLCNAHYLQQSRGKPLKKLRATIAINRIHASLERMEKR